ncbi:DUF4203 domain-containing protein [Desulfobacula sp.]|uniref:DUF4203 domain-containing protein n=1 Tax=Desulfobacula sp. TaxID=2593537 RepID=UPI00262B5CB2|nr:DUF4203 domain-containing protein [Desulfobacula sp.]
MTILNLMTGVLLLLAGRRLFWVSVACVGFIVAYRYTVEAGVPGPAWIVWAVPLGIGLIGAIVALVYQKLAVILVGFMIGGLIVMDLFHNIGFHGGSLSWMILLVGGLVGAIAILFVFDWALIVLSSLAGAFVIVPLMGLDNADGNIAFVILAVIGMATQAFFFLKIRKQSKL